jgi:hypothetical protein
VRGHTGIEGYDDVLCNKYERKLRRHGPLKKINHAQSRQSNKKGSKESNSNFFSLLFFDRDLKFFANVNNPNYLSFFELQIYAQANHSFAHKFV